MKIVNTREVNDTEMKVVYNTNKMKIVQNY